MQLYFFFLPLRVTTGFPVANDLRKPHFGVSDSDGTYAGVKATINFH